MWKLSGRKTKTQHDATFIRYIKVGQKVSRKCYIWNKENRKERDLQCQLKLRAKLKSKMTFSFGIERI